MGADATASETVFSGQHVLRKRGTFALSEATRTIQVTVNSDTTDYVAFMPGDQCILVRGPLGAANLIESWYSDADYGANE
jgi:hypothetical protein